ncbi:hypothetical protein INT43_001621 [Umbelopsis isabellina]|uniref:Cytochrome b-c1 complex subunit 2, mitochondrial n=1 Tax=Mortierella isabellina TaxID=91625 RepID=A0A8H7UDB5_MORIS|nr:hypothetical protein INT43_001621 [Umbelopsis isabellina]
MLASSRKAVASVPTILKANYSAAAAANGAQISSAKNGIKVASVQDASATAGLAVVVKGGVRGENSSNAGVSHFLKNYGFKNTNNRTALRIVREAEIAGAVLSSSLTRESIVYSAEFLKGDASQFAEILGDVVSGQKFQDHEFVDVSKQTALESAHAYSTPAIAAIEAAHNAAFRNGLGNSLYASKTSRVSNAAVKEYAQQLFTSGNVALVGTNVDHEELKSYADAFFNLGSGSAPQVSSKYHGGELRLSAVSPFANYVLAFEGVATGSKEFAAAQVLKHILGGEHVAKWANGASLLAQASSKFSDNVDINAFNFGYKDAGLFGVQVNAPTDDISSALSAVAEQLKAVQKGVSSEDLKRGIAQAKFAAASPESRLDRLDVLGRQAHGEEVAAYDNVQADDVAKVAESILKSNSTAVAVGNLHALPFADSLSL